MKRRPTVSYPPARRSDAVVTFHGTAVPDPYQWMHDRSSPETKEWLVAQHRLTDQFLHAGDMHKTLVAGLASLWSEEFAAQPAAIGRKLFQYVAGKGEHAQMMMRDDLHQPPRPLLECDRLPGDRPNAPDPMVLEPSPSGRYVGCAFGPAGDDLNAIRVLDCATGKIIDDSVEPNLLNALSWHPDETGFYYYRLRGVYRMTGRQPEEGGLYWHPLGGSKAEERLVYPSRWNHGWIPVPYVDAGNDLLWVNHINIITGENGYAWSRLGEDDKFHELTSPGRGWSDFLYCDGREAYFSTNIGAKRGHIVAWKLADIPGTPPRIVVPETKYILSQSLKSAKNNAIVVNGVIYITYLQDGQHRIHRYDLDGKYLGEINLPTAVTVNGLVSWNNGEKIIINAQSFVLPPSLLVYDPQTGDVAPLDNDKSVIPLKNVDIRTEFYHSSDGVRVPMTVVSLKALPANQPHLTQLTAYGGLGYSLTPRFGVDAALWVKRGGIYAVAHIRGGGEYGDDWHNAGRLEKRQQVHDDLHWAAMHLIKSGITTRDRLGIRGVSLGGFLVTACRNQRPDLYGAVVSVVPLVDLLASMVSKSAGVTGNDLGHPDHDVATFERHMKLSPLHNLGSGSDRPPLFLLPAELDNRVPAEFVYKFTAQAQHVAEPGEIVFMKLLTGAGHTGLSRTDKLNLYADYMTFLYLTLHE